MTDDKPTRLSEVARARAFAAGFKAGQHHALMPLDNLVRTLEPWEQQEAQNALAHGFEVAAEVLPK